MKYQIIYLMNIINEMKIKYNFINAPMETYPHYTPNRIQQKYIYLSKVS